MTENAKRQAIKIGKGFERFIKGVVGYPTIAKRFSVSQTLIYNIINNLTWKQI